MECWYFFFEGVFRADAPNNPGFGVFSSALVPKSDERAAYEELLSELEEDAIDLLQIKEKFCTDFDEIDQSNPENLVWLSWYEEVKRFDKTVFAPWQLYPRT